jgi:hypothetical protein
MNIEKVIEDIMTKKDSMGYFFIINEVVHPMYLGPYDEPYSIEVAWEVLCSSFLNAIYKTDLKDCMKYVIRGKIEDQMIVTGNPAPYYLDQIKFCFKLRDPKTITNDEYAVVNSINEKDRAKVEKLYQNFDYFSSLPWTVKFELNKYNTMETKAIQARAFTERYSIAKRLNRTKEIVQVQ